MYVVCIRAPSTPFPETAKIVPHTLLSYVAPTCVELRPKFMCDSTAALPVRLHVHHELSSPVTSLQLLTDVRVAFYYPDLLGTSGVTRPKPL